MEKEQLERMASILGDPSRMKMLWALLDGRAYTATELSIVADASRQSTSMHLGKLVEAGLLKVNSQGRHKYYSFATQEIAYAIEAMSALAPKPATPHATKPEPVKYCRTCYDHMAGLTGVKLFDRLIALNYILLENDKLCITETGKSFFEEFGIEAGLLTQRRPFLRPCLDWSERRFHLAGSLGNALLKKMLEDDWVRRMPNSRALVITATGKQGFWKQLQMEI
ncbi:ArsR/SmtB family transcription factor [Chitinophaga sp. Hz27]|uniref:ArsR/SmtB family transcription factor n=1 Tax=Chitinophaga sp. Hz27 TaxID=3347169 RepID=UPI0035E09790